MESPGETIQIRAWTAQLPLRVRPSIAITDAVLFDFCALNRDLRIERTKEGELIIMSPAGGETGHLNSKLTVRLGAWAERDGTGIHFDSSTGFVLPNGAERSPDFAWIKKERWNALPRAARRKFPPLCPDFVVELRSPSDSISELKSKSQEYIDNGASLAWLIDPDNQRVFVFRPGQKTAALRNPASLSGNPVLPGLVFDLRKFW